jgi:hypothetical protein
MPIIFCDTPRNAPMDMQACTDALRAKVEALLKADAEAGDFMAAPTSAGPLPAAVSAEAPSQEQPGAQLGRYKLLEQIGEGGMGTIWMAEQREPVKRRVALKVIKRHSTWKCTVNRSHESKRCTNATAPARGRGTPARRAVRSATAPIHSCPAAWPPAASA